MEQKLEIFLNQQELNLVLEKSLIKNTRHQIAIIYGIITFGSRVDIILPDGYETKVKVGDYLYGGKSAL